MSISLLHFVEKSSNGDGKIDVNFVSCLIALSTNNKGMNTWAGARPAHANKKRPGSRTRNFSDAVDVSAFFC